MRKEIRDHLNERYWYTTYCDGKYCDKEATWVVKKFFDPMIYNMCEDDAFPLRFLWRLFLKWMRTLYRGKYRIHNEEEK